MNIRAGLGEYILQTHNTIFLKIQWGGLNPLTLPSGYATGNLGFWKNSHNLAQD